jgi:hypothetical protein
MDHLLTVADLQMNYADKSDSPPSALEALRMVHKANPTVIQGMTNRQVRCLTFLVDPVRFQPIDKSWEWPGLEWRRDVSRDLRRKTSVDSYHGRWVRPTC